MANKMTMLEMVQGILSDMDSDEINAIGDTVESEQVAWVIEQTFRNLTGTEYIPEHEDILQCHSLSDLAKPNYLKLPTTVDRIDWVKYNVTRQGDTRIQFEHIDYVDKNEFLNRVLGRNTDDSTVTLVQDFSGVRLPILNDRPPSFWTSFDDEHMVFDAYDSAVETTMQESKSIAYGKKRPVFNRFDNDFIPDVDANFFPLFYNEAKLLCFDQFSQKQPVIVAGVARQQKIKIQNDKHAFDVVNETPDYGRKSRTGRGRFRGN